MNAKTKLKIWAISLLAGLELVAIIQKIDGSMFGLVVAAIAGLAGYELGKKS